MTRELLQLKIYRALLEVSLIREEVGGLRGALTEAEAARLTALVHHLKAEVLQLREHVESEQEDAAF
jgi:hypothetical protein